MLTAQLAKINWMIIQILQKKNSEAYFLISFNLSEKTYLNISPSFKKWYILNNILDCYLAKI